MSFKFIFTLHVIIIIEKTKQTKKKTNFLLNAKVFKLELSLDHESSLQLICYAS